MMKSNKSAARVALVTESLWKMAGANRVLEALANEYPQADIYALFGSKEYLSEDLNKHNIQFSFLNRFPLIKKTYRYTFVLWPIAMENFDLSSYDLVISNTSSVAHGVVTPLECKHIAYVNSPMRYLWDLSHIYAKGFGHRGLIKFFKDTFLNIMRMWDVVAAQRPDVLISNSHFVAKRILKYWDRNTNYVVHPPVNPYEGEISTKRDNYFLSGAPFEPNKKGDFLLECASEIGFNLKIIGGGSRKRKLKRKYSKYKNIEFLNWVSEQEKWELISKAKGYIVPGIEDYGIFCAEAVSCGTPVLAYRVGGSVEIVQEGKSGMFFDEWNVNEFKKTLNKFEKYNWKYENVKANMEDVNTVQEFRKKIKNICVE
jgi:glycosyltransferase involved in cell wall biosynthesis